MMLRLLALSLVTLALASCLRKEAHDSASYRIDCRLSTGLKVMTESTNGGVTVITDTVAPGTVSEIVQVNECSGGHVLPSNFLSRFTITTTDSTGTHEVYSGVNNADWLETGSSCGRKVLLLVVE